ncbi:MAG TPA: hypothetical protein VHC63_17005 [Acidimicrobiales bacterium]|nr:hypothetical protein [Acidimicrobiales bacterium]
MLELVDEFRHTPGTHPLWAEAWSFEAVAPDLSWGLYARLTLTPEHAWWWSVIVRQDEPLLLVRDQHLDVPRGFEVRGAGLWADLTCHEAMQRWQVNFEGFAVALDDPRDAYGAERGDRTAVEFEFEWEATASPFAIHDGYGQRCAVTGDAQIVGSGGVAVDEPVSGYRDHTWGVVDWWTHEWVRVEGAPAQDAVIRPELSGGVLIEPVAGHGRRRLERAASVIVDADGVTRVGWAEWNRAT